MPKKKPTATRAVVQRARELKKLGVDIDLRKKIDAVEAHRINRIYRKLGDVVKHPDQYVTLTASRAAARAAKNQTLSIHGDKIFVKQYDKGRGGAKLSRFDTIRIKDKQIITTKRSELAGGRQVIKREVIDLKQRIDPNAVEDLIAKKFPKGLPKGAYIMARADDKSPFGASLTVKELYRYVNEVQARAGGSIGKISIVIRTETKAKPKRKSKKK